MEEVTESRTKLLRGYRWPKDRYGEEIDVGDYLMCVLWSGYPVAVVGRVIRVGKTGKVSIRVVKTHPKDTADEQEIKEIRYAKKLSQNVISALVMDKLASE